MRIKCVTALFDIQRDKLGDGRTIKDYLTWFKKTLDLKCDFVVYTEKRFEEFVIETRSSSEFATEIIIQRLDEVPFYHKREIINEIINSDYYKSKMTDISRIECYLAEYNVIQFSKFGWLRDTVIRHTNLDFVFWMDAGCSRFFDDFDINLRWPNVDLLDTEKIILQGNGSFSKLFPTLEIDTYMWNNNSIIVGTLFGGNTNNIIHLHDEIINIFNYCETRNCVNNDQNALAIFLQQNTSKCNLFILLNGTHLPLFKYLGRKKIII